MMLKTISSRHIPSSENVWSGLEEGCVGIRLEFSTFFRACDVFQTDESDTCKYWYEYCFFNNETRTVRTSDVAAARG